MNLSSFQVQKNTSYWSNRNFCVDNRVCLNILFYKSTYHVLCAAAYMGKKDVEKTRGKWYPKYPSNYNESEVAKDKNNKSSDLSQYPKLYYKILFSILWVYEVFNIFLLLPALYN